MNPPILSEGEGEKLLTFGEFLENYTSLSKKDRKAHKVNFTDPGGKGEACREHYLMLENALTPPPEAVAEARARGLEVLVNGQYHIVPSFFLLVSELDARGLDFRIIFRTFGVDVARVASEFNMYCEGTHPVFPGIKKMDGRDGSVDRRLRLPHFSCRYHRTAVGPEGVAMAHISNDVVVITHGAQHCLDVLLKWFVDGAAHTAAIQDDYEWWAKHGER